LSVDSLKWASPLAQPPGLGEFLRTMRFGRSRSEDRRDAYVRSKQNAAMLHDWLEDHLDERTAHHFGLNRSAPPRAGTDQYRRDESGKPTFEVHSVRAAHRVAPDGDIKVDVIIVITQRRNLNAGKPNEHPIWFRGGCTLVVDPNNDAESIRYIVRKNIESEWREKSQREFLTDHAGLSLHALYFNRGSGTETKEPFALLHIGH
jgi:hypothetical protein